MFNWHFLCYVLLQWDNLIESVYTPLSDGISFEKVICPVRFANDVRVHISTHLHSVHVV